MTNKIFTLLLFTILSLSTLQAYNNISVLNPQQQWQQEQGTIEEASFTIHPRGIYMEIGMYLTVSARSTYFEEEQGLNLEAILDFDLPEGAIVHDSWLWIGEDIIRAKILDKWTAANIYEEIVGRNQDPSILFKQGSTQYQLRIFPMEADSTRRVKITYLMPADFTAENISVNLPIALLKKSNVPLEKIQIQAYLEDDWKSPQIIQLPQTQFVSGVHPNLGEYQLTTILLKDVNTLDFALKSPMEEGLYFTQFQKDEENFYQLAFLPSEVFSVASDIPTKMAVMLDFVSSNSSTSVDRMLSEMQTLLKRHLASTDSFNIITSNPGNPLYSEIWMSADDATISEVFKNISTTTLQTYSNQPSLFFNAIKFVQTNPANASLLFVSNTDQIRDFNTVNLWLEESISQMGDKLIPVNVLDYQDRNFQYHWIGNQNYYGNTYFYNNITRRTAGTYESVNTTRNFSTSGNNLLTQISSLKGQLDIHTTLESGFCYSRYSNRKNDGLLAVNQPFTQIGKYQGEFPFIIEANGIIADKIYSGSFAIERDNINTAAIKTPVLWTGNHVNALEKEEQTNGTISEIIRYSLDNRVLSLYTAFLALEVAQGGEICESCVDGTDSEFEGGDGGSPPPLTAVSEVALDSLIELEANPNPFSEQTTITITLGNEVDNDQVHFTIVDAFGRAVRTFPNPNLNDEKTYQFEWNGTDGSGNQLAKGMYIFNVKTNIGQKNLKLLFIK